MWHWLQSQLTGEVGISFGPVQYCELHTLSCSAMVASSHVMPDLGLSS